MSAAPRLVAACPAKINLALAVIGRRPDGYHELDTLFQTIDLWDSIELRPGADLTLRSSDPSVPSDGRNLVLRAAALVRERAGRTCAGATIDLHKSIPTQAGLGGGSSDAAGALRLFAEYWEVDLSDAELSGLARALGADVPFFLHGGTARGTGRGDRIEPLRPAGPLPLVLGLPPFGASTAEVFGALAAELTLDSNDVRFRPVFALKWQEDNDFSLLRNDLERVVFRRWPELARFRDELIASGARHAMLSGSGSTVYGVFADPRQARETARDLRARHATWRIVETRAIDASAHVVRRVER